MSMRSRSVGQVRDLKLTSVVHTSIVTSSVGYFLFCSHPKKNQRKIGAKVDRFFRMGRERSNEREEDTSLVESSPARW